jgi:hypothetical protein
MHLVRRKETLMRFVDWFYAEVYLPAKRKWARARVDELAREQLQLLERRDELYRQLMDEVRLIETCVQHKDDHGH